MVKSHLVDFFFFLKGVSLHHIPEFSSGSTYINALNLAVEEAEGWGKKGKKKFRNCSSNIFSPATEHCLDKGDIGQLP